MAILLLRLIRRLEPQEGWLTFLVPWLTLEMLAYSLQMAGWVPGLAWLSAAAIALAYGAGFALSRVQWKATQPAPGGEPEGLVRRPLPGWAAALILAVLGLLVVSLLVGWGLAPAVREDLRWYLVPLARAGLAWLEVAQRLVQWAADVAAGGAQQDDAVFRWIVATLAWAASGWAAWWIFRRRRPVVALLPLGVLLATNAYFSWEARIWLPAFLGGLVMSQALVQQHALRCRWQESGMDYSQEIRQEALVAAAGIAVTVAAFSAFMPRVVFQPTARWFAGVLGEPLARVEEGGQQLFPGLRRSPNSLLASGGGPGGLPRSFLLDSGPELSQVPVLQVTTGDLDGLPPGQLPPAGARSYWRALTYDTYDGRGWRNGPVEDVRFGAGEPWTEVESPWRRPLRQQVQMLRGGDRVLFAAGDPLSANRPYRAQLRTGLDEPPDDLVALLADSRRYDVLSLVPAAGEDVLRTAGTDYPPEIVERYLALPEVPPRVLALAGAVTGLASTPYDKALALETYLRSYPYDLQVPPPPPGRDVADYFLFDLRTGYCDYYATAMVVMARGLGIPARLAVGYATGDYVPEIEAYLVHEDDAHSWPELYFPQVGWVPFEPTASRPVFDWQAVLEMPTGQPAGDLDQVAGDLQTFRDDQIVRQRVRWLATLALLALTALVGWLVWRRRPAPGLEAMYERLGRWGRRLGRPPRAGDTPNEFGRSLYEDLAGPGGGRSRHAAGGVLEFVENFELAQYSPRRDQPAREAGRLWGWLEPLLRRIWLLRLLRPRPRGGEE